MKIFKLFEEHFWLPIGTALVLGLLFPFFGKNMSYLIIPMFMLIFFLTCLKIDFIDVIKHIKKPLFISYILVFYLLVIPTVLYLVFRIFNAEYAIGILLLTAIPPGTVSPVFTDIAKGNTTLSMAIALCCYLVSPFTITFLFFILTRTTIHLDLLKLFYTLLLVNFLPLILAQIVRRSSIAYIEKTKKYFSFITIFAIAFVIYIVIATQQSEIVHNPTIAVLQTLGLYVLFFLLYIIGYYLSFKRKKEDRIAVAITKMYMNNALAISIAATVFSPKIALLMVLSEIPFGTSLGLVTYFQKYIK